MKDGDVRDLILKFASKIQKVGRIKVTQNLSLISTRIEKALKEEAMGKRLSAESLAEKAFEGL